MTTKQHKKTLNIVKTYIKGLSKKVLMGDQKKIPLSKLRWFRLNREEQKGHTKNLLDSILDNFFLRPVIVFNKSDDGYYDMADVSHLTESIRYISENESKTKLPCYILTWIDGNDDSMKKKITILLNGMRKNWNLKQFVRAHALDWPKSIYQTIFQSMKDYVKSKKGLTPGLVASCYTRDSRNHDALRIAKFDYDLARDLPFTDHMLKSFYNLSVRANPKKKGERLSVGVLREIIERLWKSIEVWGYDFSKYEKFMSYLIPQIETAVENKILFSDKDMMKKFYTNVENGFLASVK